MASFITERFKVTGDGFDVEMYLNDSGELFVASTDEDYPSFWFTLTKDDWEKMKEFVDEKFRE